MIIHTKEYHPIIKKEPTIDTHNLDESPKNYAECKTPTPKVYILYDSTLEMIKFKNEEQIKDYQGLMRR